jgi:putative ABC transport system ATP-binding protein
MPVLSPNAFETLGTDAIQRLCGEQRHVDLLAVRRSLADAMLAWPGEAAGLWWRWIVESSRSQGYAARVIDASLEEILELLRHGGAAVTFRGAEADSGPRMLVLTGEKRRKVRLAELPDASAGEWVTLRQLRVRMAGGAGGSVGAEPGAIRWVILDPMADDVPRAASAGTSMEHGMRPSDDGSHSDGAGGAHDDHGHSHRSPWSRLREFLQPELSDIWIIVVFALVTGLLTLATPIAVEALVNTVAFGTLLQPLVVLSVILLTFLVFAAALRFLQRFVIELIQRRLLARVASRLAWQLPRVRLSTASISSRYRRSSRSSCSMD